AGQGRGPAPRPADADPGPARQDGRGASLLLGRLHRHRALRTEVRLLQQLEHIVHVGSVPGLLRQPHVGHVQVPTGFLARLVFFRTPAGCPPPPHRGRPPPGTPPPPAPRPRPHSRPNPPPPPAPATTPQRRSGSPGPGCAGTSARSAPRGCPAAP